ncbi:MAG: Fumarate hydratase class II [Candidatus Methanofastidiosum methylothiophilum]|jgi:argininosuccinate lyase|uniref:Argininosuccinate lyase n=1 Tax=Candidatus Methanofastidiosum methylothiophilum TaxID=1705564 RepID=A0A150JEP0_9EURY|nr:MAG: Fumarate hydratase class II [Candidatus Methanofastidiosum methylthiophilus]MBP6932006.1 argininosuccinate lyase [Methanofastidiosum sp.]OQC52823.1 MAG: Fumarate hydratase class II [Euryarchaeota archaeon ADurb.Bin023]KYC57684.1 MAG: Fumarate hydratase class II [Candidatus Methanofastidiosum methylthiophilus]KYC58426.1 MAG: Fumarate hydratase class II [Candidatus Methanofastidiosum methylthiophilus]
MAKLWKKKYELDKTVEDFTVGDDYLWDTRLIKADIIGNIAHTTMLQEIGIISEEELRDIKTSLMDILDLHEEGKFKIKKEDEDVHTAVENFLTKRLGDVGKKIHTARSRNDQILLDVRLYSKERLFEIIENVLNLCKVLLEFSKENEFVPMPGRTHTQRAMPSSVGLWASAFVESLLDDLYLLKSAFKLNNQSPLGSAASYGVNLNIDREYIASLLGFEKVQNNVLYANNSRGKIESIIIFTMSQIMMDLSKFANDLILFSIPEFNYFSLPDEFCGGSSLMPQKKNPALLELTRAKAQVVNSHCFRVAEIITSLYSGYNRDFQLTKGPLIESFDITQQTLYLLGYFIPKIKVNEEILINSFTPEIYATDRVLELVKEGVPFRDAYKEVGINLDSLNKKNPVENIKSKTHVGATGNLNLSKIENILKEEEREFSANQERFMKKIENLIKI